MRLIVDSLIAVVLLGTLGGIGWHRHEQSMQLQRIEAVQAALRAIHIQATYHAGLGEAQLSRLGHVQRIDVAWFGNRPTNVLTGPDRPWMDHATDTEQERWNPPTIVCDEDHPAAAMFWYNPLYGVARARVPRQMSDQATVELYNLVNGTSLRPDDVTW